MRRAYGLWLLLLCAPLAADEARIAVASNFMAPAEVLAERLAAAGEHQVILVSGSTGRLYAQIVNGAPYEALLEALKHHAGLEAFFDEIVVPRPPVDRDAAH